MSSPATLVSITPDTAASDQRLAALWKAHYGEVLAYAMRRAPADAAAEVAAAAFTVLWQRIDNPPADPLPWLYAVARRQLANQRRGARRRGAVLARVAHGRSEALTTADIADSAVEGSVARAALARLRPADREVLMLVAWDGLDLERAASALGVSPATFAVRLHRARRRLEAQLSPTAEEYTP